MVLRRRDGISETDDASLRACALGRCLPILPLSRESRCLSLANCVQAEVYLYLSDRAMMFGLKLIAAKWLREEMMVDGGQGALGA